MEKLKINDLVRNDDKDESHDYILVRIDMWSLEEGMCHREFVICKDMKSMKKLSDMIKSYKDLCKEVYPDLERTPYGIDYAPIYDNYIVRFFHSGRDDGLTYDESGNISFWGSDMDLPQLIGYVNFSKELIPGLRDVYDAFKDDNSDYWLHDQLEDKIEKLQNFLREKTKGKAI